MPSRPPHPCPRCGALIQYQARCACTDTPRTRDQHQRAYTSKRWRKTRAVFLARNRWCLDCGAQATVADHSPNTRRTLVALGVLDPDAHEYLEPRCARCHNKRTAKDTPGGWHRPHTPE